MPRYNVEEGNVQTVPWEKYEKVRKELGLNEYEACRKLGYAGASDWKDWQPDSGKKMAGRVPMRSYRSLLSFLLERKLKEREDRGAPKLRQEVGELKLRVMELEAENADLRTAASRPHVNAFPVMREKEALEAELAAARTDIDDLLQGEPLTLRDAERAKLLAETETALTGWAEAERALEALRQAPPPNRPITTFSYEVILRPTSEQAAAAIDYLEGFRV